MAATLTNFAINGTLLDANPVAVSFRQSATQFLAYGDQIIATYTSLSASVTSMLVSGYATQAAANLHVQTNKQWVTNIPILLLVDGTGSILFMTILDETNLVTPLYPAQVF
jgi:hypothetical protein